MIEIDGSIGEGGGQVLRSALALSVLTGQPTRVNRIRANRSKPGLRAQHFTAVQAAAAVSAAEVEGAAMGSQHLTFSPGEVRSGAFTFDIGTAGSASLVLQTIFLPLSAAGQTSEVSIVGGTHVPWSPSFHYLDLLWLPTVRELGYYADLRLPLAGFYPRGGGRLEAEIRPAGQRTPFQRVVRGSLRSINGISAVANLSLDIARRQKQQALDRLRGQPAEVEIVDLPARSKGTMLLLLAEFEHSRACFFGLGARGKPAERVADEAVDELQAFLATEAAVGPYLADQLLLPLALARGPSRFSTSRVTGHLLTQAEIIRSFLPVEIEVDGEEGQPGTVSIQTEASEG